MGSRGTVKRVKYLGSNGGKGNLEIIQRYISVFIMFITVKISVSTIKNQF